MPTSPATPHVLTGVHLEGTVVVPLDGGQVIGRE